MKRTTAILLVICMIFNSCVSSTLLDTKPSKADVYADGKYLGKTPVIYSDSKIMGSETHLLFKKEGYLDLETLMFRDEELDITVLTASLFLYLLPILWVMGYDDHHLYNLHPDPNYKKEEEKKEEEKDEEKKDEQIKAEDPAKDSIQPAQSDTTSQIKEEPKKEEPKKETDKPEDDLPDEEEVE